MCSTPPNLGIATLDIPASWIMKIPSLFANTVHNVLWTKPDRWHFLVELSTTYMFYKAQDFAGVELPWMSILQNYFHISYSIHNHKAT